jgi:homoserine O-acetyltransferase
VRFCGRYAAAWLGLAVLTTGPASAEDAPPSQQFADLGSCETMSGTPIADCRIGYRTVGTLNEDRSNAVLVPTWYRGTSEGHVFLASSEAIDPSIYFIIFADAIGNGVSISPSNSTAQPLDAFPQLRIVDMVDAQHHLLTEQFGIEKLHAIVGISMGGMQAFEWGVRYPDFADRIVAIVGSPQLPAFDIALWRTQNLLVTMARDCQCDEPLEIRSLVGVMTEPPEVFSKQVSRELALGALPPPEPLAIGSTWDGQRQAEAMMYHDIARDLDGDLTAAAEAIVADVLVIVAMDDRVVTPHPALKFAEFDGAESVILDSGCGHGAFRCESQNMNSALQAFLASD